MKEMSDKIEYPIILNKYLALKKICSRKEADRLLREGKIKVNGKIAEPGMKVFRTDIVETEIDKKLAYLAYYKPRNIITHSPQGGELSIADVLSYSPKVAPLGRLDKASRGLLILSNDGRITDRLLNPNFFHEKEYEVRVDRELMKPDLQKLSRGVVLDDGYVTRACKVESIGAYSFRIILTEGKKRQIRRMCQAIGFTVKDLKRVRIMNIDLGRLKPGEYREIKGKELEELLSNLQLK
ncbi:rRNA pseudouridine synthase [Candidatus Falkowbacteria bacterium]|nr:rRNA pseudouridine synthase [Candidatus Falkowbacteria bacterium]